MEYSGELTGVGVGVPALLRAIGNEGHYLLLPEISQEFCTLLLPPTLWVDLEWDPAGSCVTCSPGSHSSTCCWVGQPEATRHRAAGSRSASLWAHVINEEMTSSCEALLASSLLRGLLTAAAGPQQLIK